MAESKHMIDSDKPIVYKFRFGMSDKMIHLSRQELLRIPYISALVAHKDDFISIQNENDEFVLNHPFEYAWFKSILLAVNAKQPQILFNELPEDADVIGMLQLFDFLSIRPFSPPLLKNTNMALSESTRTNNHRFCAKYHQGNLLEVRTTAAEFVIALSKNTYNLQDSYTSKAVFSLAMTILINPEIFSLRFRYHTLRIVEHCCYSFLSKSQQRQLPTTENIIQQRKRDSFIYLYNDNHRLPYYFFGTFTWRGVCRVHGEVSDNCLVANSNRNVDYKMIRQTISTLMAQKHLFCAMRAEWLCALTNMKKAIDERETPPLIPRPNLQPFYQNNYDKKKNEIYSNRSRQYSTLPKPPKLDHFNHQFGSKTQKYR